MPPRRPHNTNRNRTSTSYNYWTNTWRNKSTRSATANYTCNSPKYRNAKQECQWRIGSYRNVYSQFAGTNKTAFSPTMANRWVRYVNNGHYVYKFNSTEFCRNFGGRWAYANPTAAYRYLRQKYGPTIKDVTRGNNNCWLIATTKNVTGRPFTTYDWT